MARRVNTKFLTIVTVVVIGGLALAVVVPKILSSRRNPARLAQLKAGAEAAIAQYEWEKAAVLLKGATALASDDADLFLKYGDVLHQLTRTDPQYLGKDEREGWRRAAEARPDHIGTRERLFRADIDWVEYGHAVTPSMKNERARGFATTVLNDLGTQAQALARLDPKNLHAVAWVQIVPILKAISDVGDAAAVQPAIDELLKLAKTNPRDADIPFYIARARLFQAQQAMAANQSAKAQPLRDAAVAVFDDLLRQPNPPAEMYFRAFQIRWEIARLSPANIGDAARQRLKELADNARRLVKLDDPRYVEIVIAASSMAGGPDDPKARENALKDLCDTLNKANRQDLRAVVAYAESLRYSKDGRKQAIDLLAAPLEHEAPFLGPRVIARQDAEHNRLLLLLDLRLDAYATTADEAERQALRTDVENSFQAAQVIPADYAPMQKLTAKKLLYLAESSRPEVRKAIDLMKAAKDQFDAADQMDGELIDLMVRSYLALGSPGPARLLLEDSLKRSPGAYSFRQRLMGLLLSDAQFDEAASHLAVLEKQVPDDSETIRLGIQYRLQTDSKGSAAKVNELLEKYPEKTPEQRLAKAAMIADAGDAYVGRTVKLLQSIGPDDAPYVQAVGRLAALYASRKEPDRAKAVIAEARQKKPGDKRLEALQKSLANASPEEQIEAVQRMIEQDNSNDPVARFLRLYQLFRSNDPKKAFDYLQQAEKAAQPDDVRVLEAMFNYWLAQPDLKKAADYRDKLANINADQAEGSLYSVSLELARGNYPAALAAADKLTRLQPDYVTSWLARGRVLSAMQNFPAAHDSYLTALRKQSGSFEAYRGLIESCAAMGRNEEWEHYISEGLRRFPDNPYFAEQQVLLYQKLDPEKALPSRKAAWEKAKDSLPAWQNYVTAIIRCADYHRGQNNKARADDYTKQAVDLLRQAIEKFPNELGLYAGLAESLARSDRYADGLAMLQQLTAGAKGQQPEAWIILAQYFWKGGNNLPEAEKAINQAIDKSPADKKVDAQRQLLGFFQDTRQWDKAIALATQLHQSTGDALFQKVLIDMLINAAKPAEARTAVEAAVAKNPTDPDFLTQMARVYIMTEEAPRAGAIAALRRAIAANANYPAAWFWLGGVYLSNNQFSEAVDALRQACALSPRNVDYHRDLASAYAQRNQLDEAMRELETALALNPYRADVRARLLDVYMSAPNWVQFDRLLGETFQAPALAGNPVWRLLAARGLAKRDRLSEARSMIEEARRLAPDDDGILGEYLGLLAKGKDYPKLIAESDTALTQERLKKLWWVHMYRGVGLAGAKKEAIPAFEAAITSASSNGNDAAVEAIVHKMVESLSMDETLQWVRAHVKEQPQLGILEALLCNEKKDVEGAKRAAESVLLAYDRLTPAQQGTALRITSTVFLTCGEMEKALKGYMRLYNEKILPDPNADPLGKIQVLNNIAFLYAENIKPANPQEAAKFSGKAMETMKSLGRLDASVLDTHGWVLVLCGNMDGVELLRKAAQSDLPDASYHLGLAHLRKNPPAVAPALIALQRAHNLAEEKISNGDGVDPQLKASIDDALGKAKALAGNSETRPTGSP